jgi:hypothetical protein
LKKDVSLDSLKLISLRKQQKRKDSLDDYILSKRLLITEFIKEDLNNEKSISYYQRKDRKLRFYIKIVL